MAGSIFGSDGGGIDPNRYDAAVAWTSDLETRPIERVHAVVKLMVGYADLADAQRPPNHQQWPHHPSTVADQVAIARRLGECHEGFVQQVSVRLIGSELDPLNPNVIAVFDEHSAPKPEIQQLLPGDTSYAQYYAGLCTPMDPADLANLNRAWEEACEQDYLNNVE